MYTYEELINCTFFVKNREKKMEKRRFSYTLLHIRHIKEALPGFGGTGERRIYFRNTGKQRPNFERNKNNIGEQGTLENKFSIFGEQGNPPGGGGIL